MPPFDDADVLVWPRKLVVVTVGFDVVLAVVAFVVVGGRLAVLLGGSAVLSLVVAVGGRLTTLRTQRWASVEEPVAATVRARDGRAVVRQWDVRALSVLSVVVVGAALIVAMVVASEDPVPLDVALLTLGLLLPPVVVLALLGLSGRVVVTGRDVTVERLVKRYVIPRHLVRVLRRTGQGGVAILLEGGGRVVVPTSESGPWIRWWWDHRPAELKLAGRILAALDAVAPEPSPADTVTAGSRTVVAAAWTSSTLVWLCCFTAAALGWVPSSG